MEEKKIKIKKHLIIFLITLLVFSSGFFLSDFLVEKRIEQLAGIQEDLRIDILSLETQFSILTQTPCENLNESTLTHELFKISQRLTSIGNTLGTDNSNFIRLKRFYSVLELKHWLLLRKAVKDCKMDIVSIIYFYAEKKNCPECEDQGYILTYLRKKYPFLRVYSFDYNLDLSALETLKSVYNLEQDLPILIINDKVYYQFKTKEEIEEILDQYIEILPDEDEELSATTTETEF